MRTHPFHDTLKTPAEKTAISRLDMMEGHLCKIEEDFINQGLLDGTVTV